MRLILANPHIHLYGQTVAKTFVRLRSPPKYFYVIDKFINNKSRSVAFFIDGTRSSFNELGIRWRIFPKFFVYLELLVWMFINGVNPLRHKVFFSLKKLNPKEDILFNFAFTTLDNFPGNNENVQFHKYGGIVVTHLTHYLNYPNKVNTYLQKIPHSFLVADNDLTHNAFFRHYFPQVKNVYYLPFSWPPRFKNQVPFLKRKNKCLGLGTFATGRSKDFRDFFGEGVNLQPMRKKIYQMKKELEPYIDCYMHDFDADRALNKIDPTNSLKVRLMKRFLPYPLLHRILSHHQRSYLAFDIVQKHNQYRMFVVPEEIIGLPSNNVFEGMACGTIFLGIDDPMYTALGMKDGVHYVAYKKDSIEDLVSKIRYFQEHPDELQQIAERGQAFVSRFRPKQVADTFWSDLEKLLDTFNKEKPQFNCSFISLPKFHTQQSSF